VSVSDVCDLVSSRLPRDIVHPCREGAVDLGQAPRFQPRIGFFYFDNHHLRFYKGSVVFTGHRDRFRVARVHQHNLHRDVPRGKDEGRVEGA